MSAKKVNLKAVAKRFKKKLKKIKVVLFDVDGILTDGRIYYMGAEMGWNRNYHAHDGFAMKALMHAGLKVGIVTGGDSSSVSKRFRDDLRLDYIFMGNEDKREAWKAVLKDGYREEEIFYMGDEFIDIPLLKRAGFSATVPNAGMEIRKVADYVTQNESGKAPAREVMDILRYAQGINPRVPDFE